jgi:hypothetical protein
MHLSTAKPFVFLIVVLALVSLACGIDFGGDSSAPSEAPESGPAAEATAQPQEPVSATAQYYTEEFESPNDAWAPVLNVTGTDTNESEFNLETANGFLTFDINTENLFSYVNYTAFDYEDVRVDARVENRGSNNNNVSLVCRYSEDDGWYEFNVANNGLYWILHGITDESGTAIYSNIYNGGSNKIKQGKDVNEYGIVCRGKSLSLYINGVETRTVQDNKFVLRGGQVGISVSSFDDLPVTVDVDWVTISEP